MSLDITSITLTQRDELARVERTFIAYPPDYAAFDTETTGLHIIYDKPFLYQFGWINLANNRLFTFVIDMEEHKNLARDIIKWWHSVVPQCPVYAGHNVKYDLHMLHNVGLYYENDNITDTMTYIRAAMDNIPTRAGGPPLGLKDYTVRYIDKQAKEHERKLKSERTGIAKMYNKELQVTFNKLGRPDGMRSWTKGYMDKLFEDICFRLEDLDPVYAASYMRWKSGLPEGIRRNMKHHMVTSSDIPYDTLHRPTVIEYGHLDIVYTLKILYKLTPIIDVRKTWETVRRENECIYPLFRMERVGFKVDKDYLLGAIETTKEHIRSLRHQLYVLCGVNFKVNQHAKMKQILTEKYNIQVKSTGSEELDLLVNQLGADEPASSFINIIQELRTLEKWIKVYMMRFKNDLYKGDSNRIYTSINQVGAASGRVTSDFQQFPKGAIKTNDGIELFSPRRMILSEGNGLVYLDYSQIELRLQALYTILVENPDMNLCRAYMPYKCYINVPYIASRDPLSDPNIYFDYNEPNHVANWDDPRWLQDEDNMPWTPTDVHGATTEAAFDITPDHPDFKKLRSMGKRVNFAKNYGAQRGRIRAMFPDFDEEQITKIDNAYYVAFPGVKSYQDYCYKIAMSQAYAVNLLGVKYYNVSGHNLINMLIQGSGAYFLKEKMVAIDKYLADKKTVFQMNIHDEMSFIWDPSDPFEIFYEIKKIMEEWDGCLVPIVADMELTTTNWAEKEDV